jgi:uncharacterized protein with von Willebrand factor type A (vWA) domain
MLTRASTAELLAARATERLAGFPGFLRANGFGVGGGDAVQALDAAQRVGLFEAALLRWSLKALLCGRSDEWRRFDALFDAWFLPPNCWQAPERRDAAPDGRAADAAVEAAGPGNDADGEGVHPRRAASRHERLASADFRSLAERDHLVEIDALMRELAQRLKPVATRRDAPAQRGRRLDLPSTIRRSIASGGTPLRLAWRDRRRVRPRLVLLIDVSRSMAAVAFFYLRLARALAAHWPDVHSFIFHTRLTAVSAALHDPDPWRAQQRLHLLGQGWAGGTRIGESLAQFERDHAPRLVHSRTAIAVFSDGYDTGDPALLAQTLARLRRRARRLVWINPLGRDPGWAPLAQGMQAALPHLDLLAPGADVASLRSVLPALVAALR